MLKAHSDWLVKLQISYATSIYFQATWGKMASQFASVTSENHQINFLWCLLSHCFSTVYYTSQCKTHTVDCRLQTGGKMQTESKMQTANCTPEIKIMQTEGKNTNNKKTQGSNLDQRKT